MLLKSYPIWQYFPSSEVRGRNPFCRRMLRRESMGSVLAFLTQAEIYKIFSFLTWILRLNSVNLNVFELTGLCSIREKVQNSICGTLLKNNVTFAE